LIEFISIEKSLFTFKNIKEIYKII